MIFVSYPKSGRTWLRFILAKLGVDMVYSHDGSSWDNGEYTWKDMKGHNPKYAKKKVVFMERDPRDTVVSAYFHVKRRSKKFGGSISEFIRSDLYGIRKTVIFNERWREYARKRKTKIFWLTYEDMHNNALVQVVKMLDYLDIKKTDKEIHAAIRESTFNKMQFAEKMGIFPERFNKILLAHNVNDYDTYKCRRGLVRGYKDYLGRRDLKYCAKIMKMYNSPYRY